MTYKGKALTKDDLSVRISFNNEEFDEDVTEEIRDSVDEVIALTDGITDSETEVIQSDLILVHNKRVTLDSKGLEVLYKIYHAMAINELSFIDGVEVSVSVGIKINDTITEMPFSDFFCNLKE